MKFFRYRRPSLKTLLGVTAAKKRIKKDLGITSLLKRFHFWANEKRKIKREVGYESKAGRLIRDGVPKPGGGCLVVVAAMTFVASSSVQVLAAAQAEPHPVNVTIDVSQVPELAHWAEQAKAVVEQWHPRISQLLQSDGFTPPTEVKLVFKKDKKGVADTTGTTISISADWVKKHPNDFGMVVHELTHVVQSYPKNDAVWLVEGIADYIRFFHYEPEAKLSPIDPAKQNYRDGYRTTAMFLAWIERTHDAAIVRKLNQALRQSEYKYDLFKQYTSKSLDRLWADFLEDKAAKGR